MNGLVPRPSHCPVFVHLQYAKQTGGGRPGPFYHVNDVCLASFPGLFRVYLPFAFTIIHRSAKPARNQLCIVVNANGGGLGTRLTFVYLGRQRGRGIPDRSLIL